MECTLVTSIHVIRKSGGTLYAPLVLQDRRVAEGPPEPFPERLPTLPRKAHCLLHSSATYWVIPARDDGLPAIIENRDRIKSSLPKIDACKTAKYPLNFILL
jgi:hypothetical protein